MFSRFFRSSLAVAAEIQGSGLGLALTKAIVELHDGTVSLVSNEGVGTTVTVDLPTGIDA
jgi:signal transduction histidine kinase